MKQTFFYLKNIANGFTCCGCDIRLLSILINKLMSHERKIEYLHKRQVIYRSLPTTDEPTQSYEWGWYYKDGTMQCFQLFATPNKINTLKSLRWHLFVIRYLNKNMGQEKFDAIAKFICNKSNGFTTFALRSSLIEFTIEDIGNREMTTQPPNKSRKVIFKPMCGLTKVEKLRIVGSVIGRSTVVTKDNIYDCMLSINEGNEKITITRIATMLSCNRKTIARNIGDELKNEIDTLNDVI